MSQLELFRRRRSRVTCRRKIERAVRSVDDVIHHENLLAVFKDLKASGGRAPGVDRMTYDDYSDRTIAAAMRDLSRQISNGEYTPQRFRIVRIPKRCLSTGENTGYRELSIATVLDRCVSAAVHRALTPLIDESFRARSFGFRPSVGVWQLLAQIEADIRRTGKTILAQDDVRNAFPSVPLEPLFSRLDPLVSDDRLLDLIKRMFRYEEGKKSIGIPQGDAFAPTALNLMLHHDHDIPASREPKLDWYRYADNLVRLHASPSDAETSLDVMKDHLQETGFQLKHVPDRITDLSKKAVTLLGYRIRWKEDHLEVSFPDLAWNFLAQKLEDVVRSPAPHTSASLTVSGWIRAYGPAFGPAVEKHEAKRILNICSRLELEAPAYDLILEWINQSKERFARVKGGGEVARAAPRHPLKLSDSDQFLFDARVGDPSLAPFDGNV